MKKCLVFAAIFIFFLGKIAAQPITIKGKITNLPPSATKILDIEMWYMDKWRQLDSVGLSPVGYFEKKISGNNGQCRIRVHGQAKAWLEFILPEVKQGEMVLDFGFIAFQQLNGGSAYLEDNENTSYFLMLSEQRKYQIKKDSCQAAMSNLVGSDPDFAKKMAELLALQEAAAQRANRVFENIERQKKGTFAGDVAAKIFKIILPSDFPNDSLANLKDKAAFFRAHFLDKVPTRDRRILFFNGTTRLLRDAHTKYFPETDAGHIDFIEKVMAKRNGNEDVDLWLFQYLLDRFLDLKNDAAVTHILKWHAPDCSSEDTHLSEYFKNLVLSLKACEVGKSPLDATLPDQNGLQVNFKKVAEKNKLTLLMFWRTSCSHCKEFKPILKGFYEKYHPMGLEVIAVCMDKTDADWKQFLQNEPMPWPNVFLTTGQREAFSKNFPVPGTPSLIAVDEKYVVKNRLVIRATIEHYFADIFGK